MKYEITKGSEEDFEQAPEWAEVKTRTDVGEFWLQKHSLGGLSQLIGHDNTVEITSFPYKEEIIAERRPITEPVWDGEGLPPIGALCRYRAFSDMPWVECKVLAWHDDEVWLKRTKDGKTFTLGNPDLFPVRSPEDVARDAGIKKIMATFKVDGELVPDNVAEAMWDAGYRKME